MPYKAILTDGPGGKGWYVKNTTTGKLKNSKPYKSKEAAEPYRRALWAAETKK